MVFGGIPEERIQFNEDTLWTGQPHDYDRPRAGDALPDIRQLVFQDKPDEAAEIVRARFLSNPIRQKAYQPFGDLHLQFAQEGAVTGYRRQLDLNTGIASVTYHAGPVGYQREVFASYPDKVLVVHVAADQPGMCSFTLTMDSPHRDSGTVASGPDQLVLSGRVRDLVAPFALGLRFQATVRATTQGGRVRVTGNSLQVDHADSATLVLAAATNFKTFEDITADPAERCADTLGALANTDYPTLRARHVADYRNLFGRVSIDLGHSGRDQLPTDQRLRLVNQATGSGGGKKEPAPSGELSAAGLPADPQLAALLFQYGRYLLISSSRPGTQAANLQGVWNELLNPPWESKYTTNINLEMNYWPAEVTNLSECHQPLFDLIHDLTISGGRTAQALYRARGWVLHHNTDLWRGTAPINNIDGVWPTGGAWLCYHLWEHYLFTRDKDFLANVAYPDMKGAALFFVDSLVKDPRTGYLVTNPSFSPEQGTLCAGPAMDMQLIRALFDSCTEAANLLHVDADFVRQLAATRAKLAPDRIGKYGQIQEWQQDIDQPNNNHRHMSPLWGLYPGAEFTPNDAHLFDAAKLLLKWRGDGSTGWSYAWRTPLWARVGNGEMAYRQLYLQLAKRMCPNLFDKCGPYQIDGNFGATAGIAEMLLQSQLRTADTGVREIDLLPAVPRCWPDGSVTNLCARDGFEVSLAWQGHQLRQVVLHSKLGSPCVLKYGNTRKAVTTTPGESCTFDGQLNLVSSPTAAE